jgi:small nuclear ribonucleoprotein B and B'
VQINYRMKVTLQDGRQMVGQMLAFDKVRCAACT